MQLGYTFLSSYVLLSMLFGFEINSQNRPISTNVLSNLVYCVFQVISQSDHSKRWFHTILKGRATWVERIYVQKCDTNSALWTSAFNVHSIKSVFQMEKVLLISAFLMGALPPGKFRLV